MKSTTHSMHEAISAGAGPRLLTPTTERTWYFTDEFNGERPVGAPPG